MLGQVPSHPDNPWTDAQGKRVAARLRDGAFLSIGAGIGGDGTLQVRWTLHGEGRTRAQLEGIGREQLIEAMIGIKGFSQVIATVESL